MLSAIAMLWPVCTQDLRWVVMDCVVCNGLIGFVFLQHLRKLHCYNTLLAVVGGLNHFSIRRLSQTWSKVCKTNRVELEGMTEFFSSNSNYATYRQAVGALDREFHIPVL